MPPVSAGDFETQIASCFHYFPDFVGSVSKSKWNRIRHAGNHQFKKKSNKLNTPDPTPFPPDPTSRRVPRCGYELAPRRSGVPRVDRATGVRLHRSSGSSRKRRAYLRREVEFPAPSNDHDTAYSSVWPRPSSSFRKTPRYPGGLTALRGNPSRRRRAGKRMPLALDAEDGDLAAYLGRLTNTSTRRWHLRTGRWGASRCTWDASSRFPFRKTYPAPPSAATWNGTSCHGEKRRSRERCPTQTE